MAEYEASITEGVKGGDSYARYTETNRPDTLIYPDFFTEVDPNSHISATSTKAEFSGLTQNEDAYLYKDFGANHFDDNFTHLFECKLTAATNLTHGVVWGMANVVDDMLGIKNASEPGLFVFFYYASGADYRFCLREVYDDTAYQIFSSLISLNTTYYCTVLRDEAVGTYGTLYLNVYSDASRETLVDSVSLELHEKVDFKILYLTLSNNTGEGSKTASGYGENYDIQEATESVLLDDSFGVNVEYGSGQLSEGLKGGESLARFIETQRSIADGSKLGDTQESYITYALEVDDAKHIHTADSPELEETICVIEGELDVELPFPTIEARGGARLDVELPFPTIEASAIRGNVGILDVTLPFPTIEATGYYGITAALDEELPFPSIYARAISGGRFDDYVLRHSRGL